MLGCACVSFRHGVVDARAPSFGFDVAAASALGAGGTGGGGTGGEGTGGGGNGGLAAAEDVGFAWEASEAGACARKTLDGTAAGASSRLLWPSVLLTVLTQPSAVLSPSSTRRERDVLSASIRCSRMCTRVPARTSPE